MIYEPKGRALEYSLLAVNHYRGCAHGCTYCYARNILKKSGIDFDCPRLPAEDFIKKLKRSALKYANTDNRCLLSFTTDPYQPLDDKYNFTREVLSILKLNNIPFQVLTKGGKRATKDFDLYGKYDAFATTMTFLDPGESQRYEPNAALPASRIEAIDEAHRRGIETWVSLEPVIEPSQSLKIIEICHPIVSLFKIGILNHVANKTDWRKFRSVGYVP